jgi:hypothetical protein
MAVDGSGPPAGSYGTEAKFTCANAFGIRGTVSSTILVDDALIAGVADANAPALATRTTSRGC